MDQGEDNFYSDKEVTTILGDSIDFGWLAETLREIILTSQTPITVGVIGDWGAGKTSIMQMTKHLLEENGNAKTIWFNAWKYDRVYDLRIAFIQRILIDINNDKTIQGQAKEIVTDLIKRVDWLGLAQSAASLYMDVSTGNVANSVLRSIPNYIKPKKPEDSIALIDDFDKKFQELVNIYAKDKKIVIFIDDLDRCLPEKAISILEAIKLFLDAEKCIFVIGINKKIIEKGVNLRYKQLAFDGADYMEKIIQIPFTLPELRDEDSKVFIEKIAPEPIRNHSDIIAKIGGNPRRIKRIINRFRLQITLAEHKPGLGVKNEIIAKLSVIELRWGKFYEDVIRYYDRDQKTSYLLNEMRNFQDKTEEQKQIAISRIPRIEDYVNENELIEFLNTEPTLWDVKIEPYIYLRKTTTPGFEESEKKKEDEELDSNVAKSREADKRNSYGHSSSDERLGKDEGLNSHPEMIKGKIGERRGRFFIVGIGGTGGNIAASLLERQDSSQMDRFMRLIGSNISEDLKGLWIEADMNDAINHQKFFKPMNEGSYPVFFIPHQIIREGSELHRRVIDKYGYDLKRQGFYRNAQYSKAIFEIFEIDEEIRDLARRTIVFDNDLMEFEPYGMANPIFDSAWNVIKPYTTLGEGDCDGILFIVSFGGGTGAGFVNPIINRIRTQYRADYPVFVLGILTESDTFADKAQFSKEGRRNLAAISAIYDLLTMSYGANGIILVDNQILLERFNGNYSMVNKFIRQIMLPMVLGRDYPGKTPSSQAIAQIFSHGLSRAPIFIPLFWSLKSRNNSEDELVKMALKDGRLFECTPDKADFAVVFCRGTIDSAKVKKALADHIGIDGDKVWILCKKGEGNNEILILLRNPYGGEPEAYKQEATLENKFCNIIDSALEYMNTNAGDLFYKDSEDQWTKAEGNAGNRLTPLANKALEKYYFGDEGYLRDDIGKTEGLAFELKTAKERLMEGKNPPIFLNPLKIFNREGRLENAIELEPEKVTMDERMLLKIVDERVEEKLATLRTNADQSS